MSSIYHKRKNQPSIHQHILNPKEDLGPMGPLEVPLGPHVEITKPVRIWSQRDFIWLSNYENRPSSLQDMSQTNLVPLGILSWAPWAPGAHILHTPKSSSNELQNKIHVNPVETFCKTEEKKYFWPILALLRVEKTPKYDPWGPIFYTLPKVVQVSLKN